MPSYAFWHVQYSKHFHEVDESSISTFIEKFVVVYFDDILIYSHSEEEYIQHLKEIFEVLRKNKFYTN